MAVFSKIKNVISNFSKKEAPLISIIIPVYDSSKEDIKKAFKSVVNQTMNFNDFEIIFVNNKSHKTAGIAVIKEYKKQYPNVQLHNTKINNLAQARNYGLKQANGKYVMFLDADCYYEINTCKLLYSLIESESQDVVGGNCIDKEVSDEKINWKEYNITRYKTKVENISQNPNILAIPQTSCNKIYRKIFLETNGITFNQTEADIDKTFNYKVLLKAKGITFIDELVLTHDKKTIIINKNKDELNFNDIAGTMEVNGCCYKLLEKSLPEHTHIILNETNNIIEDILKVNLSRETLKDFVDKNNGFFNDFIRNDKTTKNPKYLKIAKHMAKNDFQNAYYNYIDFRNAQTISNTQQLIKTKPKKDSYDNDFDDVDVSVIIPLYNSEEFLDSCLNSIHDQNLRNIEIICVDDNSTDNTLQIIKEHRKIDKRIRIIHSKTHKGLTASRNIGIKMVKGKYFTFVDSDDWLDFNCLKDTFEVADANNLDLLMFNQNNYTHKEAKINDDNTKILDYLKNFEDKLINYNEINLAYLFKTYNRATAKLYSTSFIKNNKIKFNPRRRFNDDNFSIISFLKAKRVMITTKPYYNKRLHNKSFSSNDYVLLDVNYMLRDVFLIIHHIPSIYNKYKGYYFNYMIRELKSNFHKISPEYKTEFLNHAKTIIEKAILKYDVHGDMLANLNENNLGFYEYLISSSNMENSKIKAIQEEICPDRPISIIIYTRNLLRKEVNEIIHMLLNQKMDFAKLELIFIDNKSLLNTNRIINDVSKSFPNIKQLILNDEYDESRVYEISLNYISTEYVMFLNPRYEYTSDAVISLYNTILKNNLNVVSGSTENTENPPSSKLIWTKIFRTKFLKDKENMFLEDADYKIKVADDIYKQKGIANIDLPIIKS